MEPCIRVGVDVGSKSHWVGIASPEGEVLKEFSIPHTQEGFERFFELVEGHRNGFKVAVAMEGYGGHARPLDGEIMRRGYELLNVNNLKLARFREVFPGPAKTDGRDTRLILNLFLLGEHLPLARGALTRVHEAPEVNGRLKRLTRRRRELVEEKARITNRMYSDIMSVCPELLGITGAVDNLWFLRFLISREDLRKLAGMRPESLLKISGVGRVYATKIRSWQRRAAFSPEASYVGPMVISDARRVLELISQIASLEEAIGELASESEMARMISTIPGFGKVSAPELAGEIGTISRFSGEASLALYLGMCPLTNQSGEFSGTKAPRQVDRRAKAAMMNALAHHVKRVSESRVFYEKKRGEGKSHNQALRALGRHMVRVIWCMLRDGRGYELR